jgi:hypothetical protein
MVCAGSSAGNNNDCDCEQFIPKTSKEHRCQSCGHRRTSHTDTPSATSELEEGELVPVKPRGPNYAERVYKSSKATGAFKKARKETLQGYRPSPPSNTVRVVGTSALVVLTSYTSLASPVIQQGKGQSKTDAG